MVPDLTEPSGSGFGGGNHASQSPTSTRTFQTGSGNLLTSAFDGTTPNQIALVPKASIVHTVFIVGVIRDSFFRKGARGSLRQASATSLDDLLNASFPEVCSGLCQPLLGL